MRHNPATGSLTTWVLVLPMLLILLIAVSTAGYCVLEKQSPADALYMTLVTISTVGSWQIPDMSPAGRWWTLGLIILGVGLAAATFSISVALLTEGTLHKVLGRKQVQRAIEKLSGHAVVCGCGRMGSMVADELKAAGRDVVVIEISGELFDRPESCNALSVIGDAQEESVLEAAGVKRASHLVACLPDDADNVFLTLTARQMSPSLTIISRAESPATERKLRHAGADRVVCPQTIGATRISNVITRPAVVDFVEVANKGVDLEMDQLVVSETSELAGKTLRELALPARTGTMLVAVRKNDAETVYNPGPNLTIAAGDTLILVGQRGSAVKVQKLQPETSTEDND